ncbi:phytoene desaturase family protein [Paenibacillus methanolicus]|uniref:Phytoene dehydrogenase-like protein n=1 Tax=Paenibacillus methanolicus TaxID=582686 RepID=A0A5S5C461_9BACL|nr:FAD-dependent oxidoreductase [Paenibacillus methanolicus]TYP73398.1 phytoene dehydrogenase-like protein [Paenibacillus methanolicus]
MKRTTDEYDVAVIGGGLTGLTAAVYLARAGRSVLILEKERELGGLARTVNVNGALFNLGPHAMYEGGAALRILNELGCLPEGGYAMKGSLIGILKGGILEVPAGLTPEENQEWSSVMAGLRHVDTEPIRSVGVQAWAEKHIRFGRARLFFYAMCRQWSYCDDIRRLSAGYAIKQGQLAGQGVRYVEGGWQTVVDDLRRAALQAGAAIASGCGAEEIMIRDGRVHGLKLSDGAFVPVPSVIAAAGLEEACRLVRGSEQMSLGKWKSVSSPLYAACLDIALRRAPRPDRLFALGLDEPFYFSKHSGPVSLSDDGALVMHAMRYNGGDRERDPDADKQALTRLMDLLQPGWEREVVAIRYSPNVLVAHDARTASHNGAGPAPGHAVPEVSGLYVAGDWVGSEGRLADAGMASAKRAAEAVLARC